MNNSIHSHIVWYNKRIEKKIAELNGYSHPKQETRNSISKATPTKTTQRNQPTKKAAIELKLKEKEQEKENLEPQNRTFLVRARYRVDVYMLWAFAGSNL